MQKPIYDPKTDPRFQSPYVDVDEWRERPMPDGSVIPFKFCTERGIFDVMDLSLEAFFRIVHCHAATLGAKVGMVVRTEKDIMLTVFTGNCPEETTHRCYPP